MAVVANWTLARAWIVIMIVAVAVTDAAAGAVAVGWYGVGVEVYSRR